MRLFRFGKSRLALAAIGLGLAVLANGLAHAEISPAPEPGAPVPDFALKDTGGKEHSLSENKGKIVVMSFTSMTCPYSKGAEPAYAKSAKKYAGKDVVFYSIDSHAETTPAQLAKYAESGNDTQAKLPYPILKDVDNKYADATGAKRTPEIYIVDKDGKLAYHGAIDNMKEATDPEYKNYVDAAVDELLAGKPVSEPKRSAFGCGIKRK